MEYCWSAIYSLPILNKWVAFLDVVASALIVHAIYKKYEVQPSSYLLTFLLLVLTPLLSSSFLPPHFFSLSVAYFIGFAVFYISLITSIVVYRLSPWHPLARYPGPMLAKLSKFWIMWFNIRGKRHVVTEELHRKYGRYVRFGPNELSFMDADLLPALLAPDMPRGPIWDGRRNPDTAPHLISTRSSADHALKRIPWMRAFSSANVREYQLAIARRVNQLREKLEKLEMSGSAVDLAEWMSYFSFDFMGDMAFGGGFELMHEGDVSGLWKMMIDRNYTLSWQMHLPWATRLLLKLPSATVVKFRNFTIQCAMQRKMKSVLVKDLFYHLINEGNEDSTAATSLNAQELSEMVVNGEVVIVAGSDTTSTALSGAFFYLITHPECYERLRREIDNAFPAGEDPMADVNVGTRMAEMKYLNAVINETLRLQPAVATAIQRAPEKGTGGKMIGEHWLPEGTAVNISPYVIHRDPEYFSPAPETFWPDRWIVKSGSPFPPPEKIKSAPVKTLHAAFIPFSAGHANCAGKNLALAEMRSVIVCLIQRFDMRFQEGYDTRRWEKEKADFFVMKLGELPVVLSSRI